MEAVEAEQQTGTHVSQRAVTARRLVAGEVEEVVVLVLAQAQSAGQGRQEMRRGLGTAGLFETGAVVDGQARQVSDLLTTQPRGRAAGGGRRTAVSGSKSGTGTGQEGSQQERVDRSHVQA